MCIISIKQTDDVHMCIHNTNIVRESIIVSHISLQFDKEVHIFSWLLGILIDKLHIRYMYIDYYV